MEERTRRAAMVVSHDKNFDEIYKERFRKYCMLIAKEKEVLQRLDELRNRSSTHHSDFGDYRNSVDGAINKDFSQITIDQQPRSKSQELNNRVEPHDMHDTHDIHDTDTQKKSSFDSHPISFESSKNYNAFGLSKSFPESEFRHHAVRKRSVVVNESSEEMFFKIHKSYRSSSQQQLQKKISATEQIRVRTSEVSTEETFTRFSETNNSKLRFFDNSRPFFGNEEISADEEMILGAVTRRQKRRTTRKSQSCENLLSPSLGRKSKAEQNDPIASAQSCHDLLSAAGRAIAEGEQKEFLANVTVQNLRKMSREQIVFNSNALRAHHHSADATGQRLMTSSQNSLSATNVRDSGVKYKMLKSSSAALERKIAFAKEKSLKRSEALRSLDDDCAKAQNLIRVYKSTDSLEGSTSPSMEKVGLANKEEAAPKMSTLNKEELNKNKNHDAKILTKNKIHNFKNKIPVQKLPEASKDTDISSRVQISRPYRSNAQKTIASNDVNNNLSKKPYSGSNSLGDIKIHCVDNTKL